MSVNASAQHRPTGRYYKEVQIKESLSDSHPAPVRPTPSQLMPCSFMEFQLGRMPQRLLFESFLRTKLSSSWDRDSYKIFARSSNHECHFVMEAEGYYYSAGHTCFDPCGAPDAGSIYLDKMQFEYVPKTDLDYMRVVKTVDHSIGYVDFHGAEISDLCPVDERILYICNADLRRRCLNHAGLVTPRYEVPIDESTVKTPAAWCFNRPVHCCAYCPTTGMAALGTETNLVVLNHMNLPNKVRNFTDDIYSVCFANTDGTVYYGSKDGSIYRVCLRTGKRDFFLKMDGPTTSMKVFDSGRDLVISGHRDMFCYIDTRMKKIVQSFAGHKNECYRIPFSYDKEYGLFCSAGEDNITRFWSRHNSTPLAELMPPVPNMDGPAFSFLHRIGRDIYVDIFCDGCQVYSYRAD